MRGPYGKNRPVTSLIHLLLLAASAIDLSSCTRKRTISSVVGKVGARAPRVALWLEVCIVHRSTADGQKEKKTERCRLTQARLEATGDKLTSRRRWPSRSLRVDRSPKVRTSETRERERSDLDSRGVSFDSLTTDAVVWTETLYVRDVISVFLQYKTFESWYKLPELNCERSDLWQ